MFIALALFLATIYGVMGEVIRSDEPEGSSNIYSGAIDTGVMIIPYVNTSYITIRNVTTMTVYATTISAYLGNSTTSANPIKSCTILDQTEYSSAKICDLNLTIANNTPIIIASSNDGCISGGCYSYLAYYTPLRLTPYNGLKWNESLYTSSSGGNWLSDNYHRSINWIEYETTDIAPEEPINETPIIIAQVTEIDEPFDYFNISNYHSFNSGVYQIRAYNCSSLLGGCDILTPLNEFHLEFYTGQYNSIYINADTSGHIIYRPNSGFLPSLVYLGKYNMSIPITENFSFYLKQNMTISENEQTNIYEYAVGDFLTLTLSNTDEINIRLHQYENNISLGIGYSINYSDMLTICNISEIDEELSSGIIEHIVLDKTELEDCYGDSLDNLNITSFEFKFFGSQPDQSSGIYFFDIDELYVGNILIEDIEDELLENQMPIITNWGYYWNNPENTSFTLYVNAIDPENDTLRYGFDRYDPFLFYGYQLNNTYIINNYNSTVETQWNVYVTDDLIPPINSATQPVYIPPNTEIEEPCTENWVVDVEQCTISDLLYREYVDTNECGTTDDRPSDHQNPTEACDYCTVQYSYVETDCVDNLKNITYNLENGAECCDLTQIPEDCEIPEDQISVECGYIPQHNSNLISGLVIDTSVEVGRTWIPFAGLIAILGLAGWIMFLI